MRKINFESLGIRVLVPNELDYSWDGEVDNVFDHCTTLRQHYSGQGLYSSTQELYEDIEEERRKYGLKINGSLSKFVCV